MLLAAQSDASNFALALGSLLVPGATAGPRSGEAAPAEAPVLERQIAAEPGKELPEVALDLPDAEEAPEQNCEADDDAPASEDLPFAWFALPAAPAPVAVPVAAPLIEPRAIVAERPRVEIELPETAPPGEPAPARPKDPDTAPRAVKGEATPVEATRPALEGEAKPVAASIAPRVAPLPPRRAERPLAVMPRPAPSTGAAEAPGVPVTASAPASPAPALSHIVASTRAMAPTQAPAMAASASARVVAAPVATPPLVPIAGMLAPQPTPPIDAPAVQPIREAAPSVAEAPAPRVQAPDPVAQPARQPAIEPMQPLTVASLIAQASVRRAPASPIAFVPPRRAFGESDQPIVTSIAAPSAAILQQVAAAPDAQQGALDMRRQEWAGKMVEMIEAMRDAAAVKETRISLMPDALGKVDIAVRQDGDRVHIHFAAETQAARQILADAQPRLTELAEARGIRLGQTSVDMGQSGTSAQSGQRHNETQRGQIPSAPARARATADFTQTDDRVA